MRESALAPNPDLLALRLPNGISKQKTTMDAKHRYGSWKSMAEGGGNMLTRVPSLAHALHVLTMTFVLLAPATASAGSQEVKNALSYLREAMDRYLYLGFEVYTDRYSVGNHYDATGWIGDYEDITYDDANTDTWLTGGNAIRITYTPNGLKGWSGIYWIHPGDNLKGANREGGFNLTGATQLTFWARGAVGGEKAEFKMGGISGPYGDTVQPAISTGVVTLTATWRKFKIDLAGKDLSRVVGGFLWATKKMDNPDGATIYLDDVRYEGKTNKLRLSESYTNLTDYVPPRPMDMHKYLYVYPL